jgi:hypothetical protein
LSLLARKVGGSRGYPKIFWGDAKKGLTRKFGNARNSATYGSARGGEGPRGALRGLKVAVGNWLMLEEKGGDG